ncbi:MAG: hypothetical protein OJF59_000910 [Cytophagales bacterium]|jgi:hypothetical protein|nr:hypothetical protein [Bacteroidota bacterium]MBS1980089.1 hypothetical protein [Bacteroidota bacterium]WHZ07157.1 MAG: hypothetical protein OJF59_000910 [Cytophagales bacterium]
MKGLAFSSLRVGKKYRLINFGEVNEFIIERVIGREDFDVKDLHTLECYRMKEFFKFGKGKDFEIREID